MKKFYLFFLLFTYQFIYSQIKNSDPENYLRNGMFENKSGKIITHNAEKIKFLEVRDQKIQSEKKNQLKATQTAVEMCTNGGFEQLENIGGKN